MTSDRILIERQGAIAIWRFSNPPHGYMDDATDRALGAALDALEQDNAMRAVVLTGAQDGVFIRHYDVALLERTARKLSLRGMTFSTDRPVPESPIHRCFARMEASPKAFIAAINGTAMGGGFETALACDIRLAQDGPYWLGLPEINLGILPGAGGTQRLTRLVGGARALELILRGRTVSPGEAAELGLVHERTLGPVLPRALAIAQELAAKPPLALAHIKRLVRAAAAGADPAKGHADERTLFCDLMVSEDGLARMAELVAGERDIRQG